MNLLFKEEQNANTVLKILSSVLLIYEMCTAECFLSLGELEAKALDKQASYNLASEADE